jgi:tetratricopeptide (TPR) repeat protein
MDNPMSRNLSQIVRVALLCGLLAPGAAFAQAELNPAIKAYNEGQYDRAAVYLYDFITQNSADANRAKAEFYLGQTLEKAKFYQSALFYYGSILREGPQHPYYVQAAEGLVDVAEALDDDLIIPSLLNKEYNEEFQKLRPEYLHKVNYLVGMVSHRAGQLADATAFLQVVPPESPYYARARYLLGIVTIQAGRTAESLDAASREAMAYFQEVLALPEIGKVRYTDLKDLKDLARLGVARTHYGLGEYAEAVKYYEAVPRFSEYWDEALFENGWARFQNEDLGGSLGTLQALHAPQFAGAFQPESWILKSTVYYSACLYDEAKGALDIFAQNYGEMRKRVEPVLAGNHELSWYYGLVTDGKARNQLPRAVYNYIGSNKRVRGFEKYIGSLAHEKAAIGSNQVFKGSQLQGELVQVIDQQKNILENVAGKFVKGRLEDVVAVINGFESQAEIIRFETAKGEKERLEQNANFAEALAKQKLYRPAVPAEDWEYWKFDGEFWIDEIGYYQFTLKSGCQAKAE